MTDHNHSLHLNKCQQDSTAPENSPESTFCADCNANTLIPYENSLVCTTCGALADTATPTNWLAQWNHGDKGSLAQIFRRGYHAGYRTPSALATHIKHRIMFEGKYRGTGILESFEPQWEGVCRYAATIIAEESNPALKTQKKAERERFYATLGMQRKPASAAQMHYLRMLGHTGNPPADMAEASGIIDRLRQGKARIQEILGKNKGSGGQPEPLHTTEHFQDKEF